MSQKYHNKRKHQSSFRGLAVLLFGSILVVAAIFLALRTMSGKPSKVGIEVNGSPSLKVDQEKIDLGEVKLGLPVQVSFTLTNVGDRPLIFQEEPYIEVIEGC